MAVNDFTGKNIKDTYPRLVQTDGTNLADGTGSILPLTFEGNNVKISGSLIANEYVVSSSVTNISIATLSGSTTFGDSSDDTHTFTGNITASGDISASGNIHGRDRHLKDLSSLVWDSGADNQTVFALAANHNLQIYSGSTKTVNIDASAGHITASGNISASGDLIASSSLTLGAPLSKIIGPGGNDFMALGVDNIDIFINGGEVINIDNDSINLNSSAQAINTTITSDDATHLVMADATNNAVRLNNHIIMSPGAPTDYTNRLLVSGSTHFTGSNSHITASGNIRVADASNQPTIINSNGIEFNPNGNANGTNFRVDDTNMRVAINSVEFEVSANKIELGVAANQHVTASGNISSSGEIIAASGSFEMIHGGTF